MTCEEFAAYEASGKSMVQLTRAERAALIRHASTCPACNTATEAAEEIPPGPDLDRLNAMTDKDATDPEFMEALRREDWL